MQSVSMFQAKTNLSKLVEAVVSGREKIVISRHGVSVAKLVAIPRQSAHQRVGVAKGRFVVPEDIDEANEQIARMFEVDGP